MVIAWLTNSMELAIGKPFLFMPTATEIWEAIQETYSDLENSSQIFSLKMCLWHNKQGDRDLTTYYNKMLTLWQELDHCYDDEWDCSKEGVQLLLKREENDRVYMLLAGINKDLDEVRGHILSHKPLLSIREVFSEVRRKEARRCVMLHPRDANPIA